MPKRRQLTVEQRSTISTLCDEGYTEREIALRLGISPKGVHNTLARRRETGQNLDRRRSGRTRVTSRAEERFIITTSKRDRRLTAPDIATRVNTQ